MYDIIIIGAGFSGVAAALECSKHGYKILLLEADPEIMGDNSTSRNQCYRVHTGIHYPDRTTAERCIEDAVYFIKNLPPSCLKNNTYKEYSRYYLMDNSLYDSENMNSIGAVIKNKYSSLIRNDPANKVLGEPEKLIKEADPNQYKKYVTKNIPFNNEKDIPGKINVLRAVDIIEPAINFDKLVEYYGQKLADNPNIIVKCNQKVTRIKKRKNNFGYIIETINENNKHENFYCDGVVNCAWQNIEKLNSTLVFQANNNEKMLIRMKASILAELPKEAQNIPTSLFCTGPYCAMSNLGNGKAILTSERPTNIASCEALQKPSGMMQEIQQNGAALNTKIGAKLAKSIIKDCSSYLPALKQCKPLEVRIGYVKTPMRKNETYSIYTKKSPIHKRRHNGVEVIPELGTCFINGAGMKFTYILDNAKEIAEKMHVELEKKKHAFISKLKSAESNLHYLQRHLNFNYEMFSIVSQKFIRNTMRR